MMGKVKTAFDQEWVELIFEAKEVGMSLEEVKAFFKSNKKVDDEKNRVTNISSGLALQILQKEVE
ncbi:DNA-binding anti-repressor SinI [Oceanobacillus bengalensis]|uniref:DNA-binding anti-repressor SinI n=2 Tax=Oceanobacillus bengalensis TaxID=1435466 RepID=A0A494YR62_9BACI|nr:DNA-binding anti-repressor SinI [Oceanobacillus bengalensis]